MISKKSYDVFKTLGIIVEEGIEVEVEVEVENNGTLRSSNWEADVADADADAEEEEITNDGTTDFNPGAFSSCLCFIPTLTPTPAPSSLLLLLLSQVGMNEIVFRVDTRSVSSLQCGAW